MKVLIAGDNNSIHVQKWIKALSESSEIELSVATFDGGVKFDNVKYRYFKRILNNKLDYLLNIRQLKRIIAEERPDILHAQYATSYGFMCAVQQFQPLMITGWGADIFDSPKNYFFNKMVRYSLKKARAISVLSEITKKEIAKLTPKDVHLLPFGVDIVRFKPIKHPKETFVIGTIRTLSEKYGVEYLIRAFSIVHSRFPNARLEIVGAGILMPKLKELTEMLTIQDYVIFHGYIKQNVESVKYLEVLNNFDAFVIPSIIDSETFGVAAVEAMACEIPVIGSDVGGLPEVIGDGICGLIVPPKDSMKLAEAIISLINSPQVCKQMGSNGRQKVIEKYNWNESVAKQLAIYKSLI